MLVLRWWIRRRLHENRWRWINLRSHNTLASSADPVPNTQKILETRDGLGLRQIRLSWVTFGGAPQTRTHRRAIIGGSGSGRWHRASCPDPDPPNKPRTSGAANFLEQPLHCGHVSFRNVIKMNLEPPCMQSVCCYTRSYRMQ